MKHLAVLTLSVFALLSFALAAKIPGLIAKSAHLDGI